VRQLSSNKLSDDVALGSFLENAVFKFEQCLSFLIKDASLQISQEFLILKRLEELSKARVTVQLLPLEEIWSQLNVFELLLELVSVIEATQRIGNLVFHPGVQFFVLITQLQPLLFYMLLSHI